VCPESLACVASPAERWIHGAEQSPILNDIHGSLFGMRTQALGVDRRRAVAASSTMEPKRPIADATRPTMNAGDPPRRSPYPTMDVTDRRMGNAAPDDGRSGSADG